MQIFVLPFHRRKVYVPHCIYSPKNWLQSSILQARGETTKVFFLLALGNAEEALKKRGRRDRALCPAPALPRPLYIRAPLWGACCVGSSQQLSFIPVSSRIRTSEIQDKVRTKDKEGQTWGTHESGFLEVESSSMAMGRDDRGDWSQCKAAEAKSNERGERVC